MSFVSIQFIFLFPLVTLAYYLMRGDRLKKIWLLLINVIKLTLYDRWLKRKLAGEFCTFLLFLYFEHANKTDFHLSQKN